LRRLRDPSDSDPATQVRQLLARGFATEGTGRRQIGIAARTSLLKSANAHHDDAGWRLLQHIVRPPTYGGQAGPHANVHSGKRMSVIESPHVSFFEIAPHRAPQTGTHRRRQFPPPPRGNGLAGGPKSNDQGGLIHSTSSIWTRSPGRRGAPMSKVVGRLQVPCSPSTRLLDGKRPSRAPPLAMCPAPTFAREPAARARNQSGSRYCRDLAIVPTHRSGPWRASSPEPLASVSCAMGRSSWSGSDQCKFPQAPAGFPEFAARGRSVCGVIDSHTHLEDSCSITPACQSRRARGQPIDVRSSRWFRPSFRKAGLGHAGRTVDRGLASSFSFYRGCFAKRSIRHQGGARRDQPRPSPISDFLSGFTWGMLNTNVNSTSLGSWARRGRPATFGGRMDRRPARNRRGAVISAKGVRQALCHGRIYDLSSPKVSTTSRMRDANPGTGPSKICCKGHLRSCS